MSHRWVADGRTYAPWRYEDASLMMDPQGQLSTVPISTKETAHEIPKDYAPTERPSEADARWSPTAGAWDVPNWSSGSCWSRPHVATQRSLCRGHRRAAVSMDYNLLPYGGPNIHSNQDQRQRPSGRANNWNSASTWMNTGDQLDHPMEEQYRLEPGLQQVLTAQTTLAVDINGLRQRLCEELTALRHHLRDVIGDMVRRTPATRSATIQVCRPGHPSTNAPNLDKRVRMAPDSADRTGGRISPLGRTQPRLGLASASR